MTNFLFMDRFEDKKFFDLEIRWGFQTRYCTFSQMTHWTTKVQLLVYGPIWIFFFPLTWKYNGDSKSNIVLYLKKLTGPQKFVIMIRCKINFAIIRYSVIFAANPYLLIFVWSSDILNFFFIYVVILALLYASDCTSKKCTHKMS